MTKEDEHYPGQGAEAGAPLFLLPGLEIEEVEVLGRKLPQEWEEVDDPVERYD